MSETKEQQRERNWLEIQDRLGPDETEAERALSNIAMVRAGWHAVRNESGVTVVLPDVPVLKGEAQRALEDEWERKALAMHAGQTTIIPKPKPIVNTLAAAKLNRGD